MLLLCPCSPKTWSASVLCLLSSVCSSVLRCFWRQIFLLLPSSINSRTPTTTCGSLEHEWRWTQKPCTGNLPFPRTMHAQQAGQLTGAIKTLRKDKGAAAYSCSLSNCVRRKVAGCQGTTPACLGSSHRGLVSRLKRAHTCRTWKTNQKEDKDIKMTAICAEGSAGLLAKPLPIIMHLMEGDYNVGSGLASLRVNLRSWGSWQTAYSQRTWFCNLFLSQCFFFNCFFF